MPCVHTAATNALAHNADIAKVQEWLRHANIQNATIYAWLTTTTLDAQARTIFVSHRVVSFVPQVCRGKSNNGVGKFGGVPR